METTPVVEVITQELKYWTTWEGLQRIFDKTKTEVVAGFWEILYIKGEKKCWTVEWTRQ